METKPITTTKTIANYICPICSKQSTRESDIDSCIDYHQLKDLEKKCGYAWMGPKFETEEEANNYVKTYSRNQPYYQYDDQTFYNLDWSGPGKYNLIKTKEEEHGYYDAWTETVYTFKKSLW